MQVGSDLRSVLSHLLLQARPTPTLDEGRGHLKPSLKNLQKWRSQSLSEQLFSVFFRYIQLGFFVQQFVFVTCHPFAVLLLPWGEPGCAFSYNPPTSRRWQWGPLSACSSPGSTSSAFSCSPLKSFHVFRALTTTVASAGLSPVCQQLFGL